MGGRVQVKWTLLPMVMVSAMMSSDIAPGGSRITVVLSARVIARRPGSGNLRVPEYVLTW